jgi:hypothetical protein
MDEAAFPIFLDTRMASAALLHATRIPGGGPLAAEAGMANKGRQS